MTPETEDVLISRVIDREAGPADWEALERWASEDPGVWSRLAHGLRNDQWLRYAVAESVPQFELLVDRPARRRRRLRRVVIAAAWVGLMVGAFWLGRGSAPTPTPTPSAERAASDSLAKGAPSEPGESPPGEFELIERLPDVVLKREPSGEGFDVLCLRRTIERYRVDNVYQLGRDELGRLAATPLRLPEPGAPASF